MSDSLYNQIYNNLNLRTTNELLEIWQKNNRYEWTDTAFEAIQKILSERGEEVPPQGSPVLEPEKDDDADIADDEFSEEALAPTTFYDPVDALLLIDWLEWTGKAAILVSVLNGLWEAYPSILAVYKEFPLSDFSHPLAIVIEIGIFVFSGFLIYLFLRAIAYILKILMEFEFNSRGVK
jgi:hypothetical protein